MVVAGSVYDNGKRTGLLAHRLATSSPEFVLDYCVMSRMPKPTVRIVYDDKAYSVRTWRQNGRISSIEACCDEIDDHLAKMCLLQGFLTDG